MEELEVTIKRRIDKDGYFVCDEFTDEVSDTLINVAVPEGFYRPKWNGIEWEEGDVEAAQNQVIENATNSINFAIQEHLDTIAQKLRYDNIMSARSYAGYDNAFQAEALKLSKWASNCWVKVGQIEKDVSNGVRDMPTADEVIAELPEYVASSCKWCEQFGSKIRGIIGGKKD